MKELNQKESDAVKDLIFRMADDELILGHRNSEWTGLGPILEEDIAFSSMAQDKIGHAQALYSILNKMGESDPDSLAFNRKEQDFKCCHLVEYPIGEYDFSLMRHFLFDNAEAIRYELLTQSSFEELANVSRKFRGEIKYHTMHSEAWIVQLGKSSGESNIRMQSALDRTFPLALGIFEPSSCEDVLSSSGVFPGERVLLEHWLKKIESILEKADLELPDVSSLEPAYGGRKGKHTVYLQQLIDEMSEVYRIDPSASW